MDDLGKLQKDIFEEIPEAARRGDGNALKVLGLIASEMESNCRDWRTRFQQLNGDRGNRVGEGDGGNPVNGPAHQPLVSAIGQEREPKEEDFAGKNIRAFSFEGERFVVGNYTEMLVTLARLLLRRHRGEFRSVAAHVQGHKAYISDHADELKRPAELEPGLYIETLRSAHRKVIICQRLVAAFGYPATSFATDVVPFRTRAVKRNAGTKPAVADIATRPRRGRYAAIRDLF